MANSMVICHDSLSIFHCEGSSMINFQFDKQSALAETIHRLTSAAWRRG